MVSVNGRARALLVTEVQAGKAMQLATLGPDGAPVVCNLWFASSFEPDRLYFISRPSRAHCENVRRDPRVGGAVLAIQLDDPGSTAARGVQFTGRAVELPTTGIGEQIAIYARRWPATANAIDPVRLERGETHHRVYEIAVTDWVLYDEANFGRDPRQPVRVAGGAGRTYLP
jgi:uncharacterized protein YhbP (UPF0306 family)